MSRSAQVLEVSLSGEGRGAKAPKAADVAIASQRSELIWHHVSSFCLVYGAGWLMALAYIGLVATALNYDWPRDTFNYTPADRYGDFVKSLGQALVPNPYKNYGSSIGAKSVEGSYFPFVYVILRAFRSINTKTAVIIYMATTIAAIASMWFWWLRRQRAIWKGDSRWTMVACLSFFVAVCNYPVAFAIDRGNIDPIAVCLMFWGIELARRGQRVAGGLVIALAGSPKGFPFAAMLYWIRRWHPFAVLAATAALAALIIAPATLFEGGIRGSMRALSVNLNGFRHLYILGSASAHYSSDWINGFRLLNRWIMQWQVDMAIVVTAYEWVVIGCVGVLALLALAVIQDTWRELLAIVLIMLIYPNVTNDYKLIVLLLPLLEWFSSDARGWRSWVFCVATALLFVPKHYYFPRVQDHASISCVINPVLITALLTVVWPTSGELSSLAFRLKRALDRVLGLFQGEGGRSGAVG